jgi:hypothetical protein
VSIGLSNRHGLIVAMQFLKVLVSLAQIAILAKRLQIFQNSPPASGKRRDVIYVQSTQ